MVNKNLKFVSPAKYKIAGGIHPPEFKELSNQESIKSIAPSDFLTLILSNSHELQGDLLVKEGEEVTKGQTIVSTLDNQFASHVHSPCDGEVVEINRMHLGHPSGLPIPAIKIKTKNISTEQIDTNEHQSANVWRSLSPKKLIEQIGKSFDQKVI